MLYKVSQPFIFTLFGASGDLAKLKIFPALYQLALQKRLPKEYAIVGFSRTKKDQQIFHQEFAESIRKKEGEYLHEKVLQELIDHVDYFTGQYTDRASFDAYRLFLKKYRFASQKHLMHLAYFSVPATVYRDIIWYLGETSPKDTEELRLIIEKPFGDSEASAKNLYRSVIQYFDEKNVYLLDHYLGKSSVQSIMHLRHANRLLNLMMKGPEIANIQITAFEDIGIGERVGYFENTGIIKDFIQSHLLQTLALITMSIPITECAESIHRERYNILSSIQPPTGANEVALGQYTGYKKEKGVSAKSNTETFVALRMFIDRESWFRVPIYLRTGKKTNEKHTFVVIELKKFAFQGKDEAPNRLVIEIQPEAKISIKLLNRLGESGKYQEVTTTDSIACDIEGCLPDHANLILDAIKGDKTNFLSFAEILAAWRVTDAVLNTIQKFHLKVDRYPDGSRGPTSQDNITAKDGFSWYDVHS